MNRPRVLIVDDDTDTRDSYIRLLQMDGWDARGAATLAEARHQLERDPTDGLILDLWLSDGDGESLLEFIRDQEIPTRVLVVTGVSDLRLLGSIRERYHPAAVLLKPADVDEVLRALAPAKRARLTPPVCPVNSPKV